MSGVSAQPCPAARTLLARRLDEVAVIGEGLAHKAIAGRGLRPIVEHLGVPHTPVRTWWRRFRVRSSTSLIRCTVVVVVSIDGTAVMLSTAGERAAFEALGVAWRRAHRRFGGDLVNLRCVHLGASVLHLAATYSGSTRRCESVAREASVFPGVAGTHGHHRPGGTIGAPVGVLTIGQLEYYGLTVSAPAKTSSHLLGSQRTREIRMYISVSPLLGQQK